MPDLSPRLSRADRMFLASHGIPEDYVADMRHRTDWASCSDELREVCCYFAWGFRKCASGHRLTNGRGRCIQCHPSTIGFVLRHARPGWLYIAAASDKSLTKVGVARDVDSRLAQLNAHRLAGVRKWEAIYTGYFEQPAAFEAEMHRRLSGYRKEVLYDRKGGQIGREVFDCRPDVALDILAEIYAEKADW